MYSKRQGFIVIESLKEVVYHTCQIIISVKTFSGTEITQVTIISNYTLYLHIICFPDFCLQLLCQKNTFIFERWITEENLHNKINPEKK